jgi:hypothetical protein
MFNSWIGRFRFKNPLARSGRNLTHFFGNGLREKTGIEFILDKDESETTIPVSFKSLPIDIALERILFRLNHAYYFNAAGQIHKVIIVGAGKSFVALSELETGQAALESRRMKIEPPRKNEMKIIPSPESMVIAPAGG